MFDLLMPAPYEINIDQIDKDEPFHLTVVPGSSIVIVGANGAGKTRLGVKLENLLPSNKGHRIAAQKSLKFTDTVNLISLERAEQLLRFGYDGGGPEHRNSNRWNSKPAVHELNDFEALLQTLFAEQNRIAVNYLNNLELNPRTERPVTKLAQLKEMWERLLPHRKLELREASISVIPKSRDHALGDSESSDLTELKTYDASQMSDGERAVFYYLGQCLLAPDNGILIIDEPEAHIHKAILGKLWDSIEETRSDCGFIYITHDLDFATSRNASEKFFIRSYETKESEPERWDIEPLPRDTGLPEHVVTELVGSRKPILFVEGEGSSLDQAIYRLQYPDFTIFPIGSCDNVISSVGSYRNSSVLHRLGYVCGIIDADDRNEAEKANLWSMDIYVLPVSEVENLLLYPTVFTALAEALYCSEPEALFKSLKTRIYENIQNELESVCARYTIRRLDRSLKVLTVSAKDRATLLSKYASEIANVDPGIIYDNIKARLKKCIQEDSFEELLALYDNKGLLAMAATKLGLKNKYELEEKFSRIISGTEGLKIRNELEKILPKIKCKNNS